MADEPVQVFVKDLLNREIGELAGAFWTWFAPYWFGMLTGVCVLGYTHRPRLWVLVWAAANAALTYWYWYTRKE